MNRALPIPAFVIGLCVIFAYVGPTWSGPIATEKAAIASDDEALAAASEYNKEQDALAQAQSAIDPDNLSRLATFLPDSVDNVRLILDLNALAARSGVALSNIDVDSSGPPSTAADTNPLGSVDMSLSVSGSYTAFQTFLNGIEHSERLLDVQEVDVKGSDTGVYTYQLKVRIYWLH
ncbi:MAG: type 4a pilus biogenesis protein PilO [Minisyncoccia bacterium]